MVYFLTDRHSRSNVDTTQWSFVSHSAGQWNLAIIRIYLPCQFFSRSVGFNRMAPYTLYSMSPIARGRDLLIKFPYSNYLLLRCLLRKLLTVLSASKVGASLISEVFRPDPRIVDRAQTYINPDLVRKKELVGVIWVGNRRPVGTCLKSFSRCSWRF